MPDGSVISHICLSLSLSLSVCLLGRCHFLCLLISSMRLWEQQDPLAWMLSRACAVFPVWKACWVLAWSGMLCEALSLRALLQNLVPLRGSVPGMCWVHYADMHLLPRFIPCKRMEMPDVDPSVHHYVHQNSDMKNSIYKNIFYV